MFASVALASLQVAIDRPYDYRIPDSLQDGVVPGTRVFVPFGSGNRVTEAFVLALSEESGYPDCKEILRIADEKPLLGREQLQLAYFMRERYFCTVYQALRTMLPAGFWLDKSGKRRNRDASLELVRLAVSADEASAYAGERRRRSPRQAEILDLLCSFELLSVSDLLSHTGAGRPTLNRLRELGLIEIFQQEVLRRPQTESVERMPLPTLNDEQEAVFQGLLETLGCGESRVSLLSGVTGSGKTSIYAHLIAESLQQGKGAVLLVPEISLTPQMLARFSAWFGNEVAVMHSGLSSSERCDEWKRIQRGAARLVIGTRSAVFAPVQNLGLILMDEEQEDSYRSETNPRYHARDIARFRCHQNQAALVLGSATPDLGSRWRAETGEYGFFRLHERYNLKPLPAVHLVDMKQELRSGNGSLLSVPLREAILQRIERGEQSILFLNRRGSSKVVACSVCGYTYRCDHCSVSMTWHANRRRLICHYCGKSIPLPPVCPECGGSFRFLGAGTQMAEEELRRAFPDTGILRVDADSVNAAVSHRQLFQRFTDEKIPLMIGTQMIAKGLNFDNVTLVGVLSADQSLYCSDFRAGEHTFSLLTQVIGRCGRGEKSGEAYIQTFTPDNEIIRLAARQDYESFYRQEIEMRRLQHAPPFSDRIGFSASGPDEQRVILALMKAKTMLQGMFSPEDGVEILGPVPFPVVKISDRYRYRLFLSCRATRNTRRILSAALSACSRDREMRKVSFYIDNDPTD